MTVKESQRKYSKELESLKSEFEILRQRSEYKDSVISGLNKAVNAFMMVNAMLLPLAFPETAKSEDSPLKVVKKTVH